MQNLAIHRDALAATAILVNMSGHGSVAPNPIVDGVSSTEVWPSFLLSEWIEGTGQSLWRQVETSLHKRDPIPTPEFSRPTWVRELYEASRDEISDDQIIRLFDALEGAIYTDLEGLDSELATIDTRRLAPEFVVGIPRALFPLRDHLSNWAPFVFKAWTDLSSRPGLDVRELLQGLL